MRMSGVGWAAEGDDRPFSDLGKVRFRAADGRRSGGRRGRSREATTRPAGEGNTLPPPYREQARLR
jgi:hypothetical protein